MSFRLQWHLIVLCCEIISFFKQFLAWWMRACIHHFHLSQFFSICVANINQWKAYEMPSLSTCHPCLCLGGFSWISSSLQLCKQVFEFGLIANKQFIDAGQRATFLNIRILQLHISLTVSPQSRLQRMSPVQGSRTNVCWNNFV